MKMQSHSVQYSPPLSDANTCNDHPWIGMFIEGIWYLWFRNFAGEKEKGVAFADYFSHKENIRIVFGPAVDFHQSSLETGVCLIENDTEPVYGVYVEQNFRSLFSLKVSDHGIPLYNAMKAAGPLSFRNILWKLRVYFQKYKIPPTS